MKRLILLAGLLVLLAGCAELAPGGKYEGRVITATNALDKVGEFAPIADPFTGGWASILTGVVGLVVTTGLSINRSIVAQRRRKVIVEVNNKEGTPPIVDQVSSVAALDEVKRLI